MGYEKLNETQISEHIDSLELAMRLMSEQGQQELARALHLAAQVARRDRALVHEGAKFERVR